jgi:predicted dehydrogenase
MKFGIIGTGSISRIHARAIHAMHGSSLHSVFNPRLESAEKLAVEFGARACSDFGKFLADPELEIVTIATPSGDHLEPAMAALKAGKHVLCEKPLEITLARIDEMNAMAAACGKVLSPILNRRFTPAMMAFKQACMQNRFGKLTSASCSIKWFRDQAYYDSAPWRGTLALDGGGALMNQGIHAIDALLHLAGPVKFLRAITGCLAHERIEVEDSAVVLLEFENGAHGSIEASTCHWSRKGHPVRIQLGGTEGSVFLADESFEVWDFKQPQPEDAGIQEIFMAHQNSGLGANDPTKIDFLQHQRNFEDVVLAISEGRQPGVSGIEARNAVALIEAIYLSAARDGAKVRL